MNTITIKELRNANKSLFEKLPFVVTLDGEPVCICVEYGKYAVFTKIADVIAGTSGQPGKRLKRRATQQKLDSGTV